MKSTKTTKTANDAPALPKGINAKDLTRPAWDAKDRVARDESGYHYHEYKLWYTKRFGWVLPTLLISKGKGQNPDRYYGITVGDDKPDMSLTYKERSERKRGQQVRIGRGPHVLRQETVYVRESRLEKLQWLIDLYNEGLESANDTRDTISTKRARTAARRSTYNNLNDLFRF